MKFTRLKLEEAGIWFLTYSFLIALFLLCVAFFGDKIKNFLNSDKKISSFSSKDVKFLEETYGKENSAYIYVNNVLDFIGAYIPSKLLTIVFLGSVYLLYFIMVHRLKYKKLSRNSVVIYFVNALNSIASGACSLMFFITSVLLLGLIYVCWIGLFLGHIFWMLLAFYAIYVALTLLVFFFDKSLSETLKKSIS